MVNEMYSGVISSTCEDYYIVSANNEAFLVPIFEGGYGLEESAPEGVEFFDPMSLDIGDVVDITPIDPDCVVGFRRAMFV